MRSVFVMALLFLSCVSAAVAKPVVLSSRYVIAVPGNAVAAERTAAATLRDYVEKSTGIALPVVGEKSVSGPAFYVGNTDFARDARVGVSEAEAWRVQSVGDSLVLTGGSPRGVVYAVAHFLEDVVGVHWWNPWEESVPSRPMLAVGSLSLRGKPVFEYRDLYDGWLPPHGSPYYVLNRMNGHFCATLPEYGGGFCYGPPNHVHTYSHYFPPEEYFEKHPEFYSLVNGERVRNGQLCLTNKELLGLFIAKVKKSIADSYAEADAKGLPRPVMFSVSQNDWLGSCECAGCKAVVDKEGHSGLNLMFVNAVAEAVEKEYPDARIDTLAYWFYVDPPKSIRPRGNVSIRYCFDSRDILHGMKHANNEAGLAHLREWARISPTLYVWDYAALYADNPPFASSFHISEDYKLYRKLGVKGIFVEHEMPISGDMWDLKSWMEMKLQENPDQDFEKLLVIFTDGYYGAAGKYVRGYMHLLDKRLEASSDKCIFFGSAAAFTYLDFESVLKSERLFENASRAVQDDPVLLRRVRHARASLDRAIVLKYGGLADEYVRKYGSLEGFPLSARDSAGRVADVLVEQMKLRGFDESKSRQTFEQPVDQERFYRVLASMPDSVPMPEEFAEMRSGRVRDFSMRDFRLKSWGKMRAVADEDSPAKVAAKLSFADLAEGERAAYSVSAECPFYLGLFDRTTWKPGPQYKVEFKDITPDRYKWYKISDFEVKPGTYLYLFSSGPMEVDLDSALSSRPGAKYDLYLSAKFEGSPVGSVSVDRVVVVER